MDKEQMNYLYYAAMQDAGIHVKARYSIGNSTDSFYESRLHFIQLCARPNSAPEAVAQAARHELKHALHCAYLKERGQLHAVQSEYGEAVFNVSLILDRRERCRAYYTIPMEVNANNAATAYSGYRYGRHDLPSYDNDDLLDAMRLFNDRIRSGNTSFYNEGEFTYED